MSRASPIPCEAVVLDMDGVLVDSEDVNVASAFEAFARVGAPLDAVDRAAIVGRHPADYVAALAASRGVPPAQLADVEAAQSEAYVRRWWSEAVLIPGALEALAQLEARGFRMALATSAGRSHVERALARFALVGRFEFELTKDDVTRRKPDPEIYRRAVECLGLPPETVVVVEDSQHGVAAAKGAGLACLAVRTRHTPRERIAAADRILEDISELPEAVVRARR